jgi:hypothetical protein
MSRGCTHGALLEVVRESAEDAICEGDLHISLPADKGSCRHSLTQRAIFVATPFFFAPKRSLRGSLILSFLHSSQS